MKTDTHTDRNSVASNKLAALRKAKAAAIAAAKERFDEFGALPCANGVLLSVRQVARVSSRNGGVYVARIGSSPLTYGCSAVCATQFSLQKSFANAGADYDDSSDMFLVHVV